MELNRVLVALDERWRRTKEVVAWMAYHSGTVPYYKRPPSFSRFLRSLIPHRWPSGKELGSKLDRMFRTLQAQFRAKKGGE